MALTETEFGALSRIIVGSQPEDRFCTNGSGGNGQDMQQMEEIFSAHILSHILAQFRGRVALISSFGTESAALLALIARYDTRLPVYFLDTGCHFPETLAYRDGLVAHLGLACLHNLVPAAAALQQRDPQDQLFAFDPDACCALRKVEPLEAVMPEFDIWITGRKRAQAATRAGLPVLERQENGQVKLNPLVGWSAAQIRNFMRRENLPPHPLVAQGYRSIGCKPCTRIVGAGEDDRAGRWAGLAKTECGLHRPVPAFSAASHVSGSYRS